MENKIVYDIRLLFIKECHSRTRNNFFTSDIVSIVLSCLGLYFSIENIYAVEIQILMVFALFVLVIGTKYSNKIMERLITELHCVLQGEKTEGDIKKNNKVFMEILLNAHFIFLVIGWVLYFL